MSPGPDWSSAQYLRFEDERSRPARDLIARIPASRVARAVDLGCGPGNSTELLRDRFPDADMLGIDNSPDMLAAARRRLPGARFEAADIARWADPRPFDVILANATLQWVPGHDRLLPALLARLAPGGSLAVQMPDNLDEPTHVLMRDVAFEEPFRAQLADAARMRAALPRPRDYYDALRPLCSRLEVWHAIYNHVLDDPAAIVEWVKGTGLRPFLDPLDLPERKLYLAEYTARVAAAYLPLEDGRVMLRFPRIFIVAVR